MEGIGGIIVIIILIISSIAKSRSKAKKQADAVRNRFPAQGGAQGGKPLKAAARPRPQAAQKQMTMDMNPAESKAKAAQTRQPLRPAPPPAAQPRTDLSQRASMQPRIAQTVTSPAGTPDRAGSIAMPRREAHVHEGKPMPCPADERDRPRPRPSDMSPSQGHAVVIPGLALAFNKNTLLQGVIMSEILSRPRLGRRM